MPSSQTQCVANQQAATAVQFKRRAAALIRSFHWTHDEVGNLLRKFFLFPLLAFERPSALLQVKERTKRIFLALPFVGDQSLLYLLHTPGNGKGGREGSIEIRKERLELLRSKTHG
jgi:hypothetical protein